ncbi:hypothetical protein GIB67_034429 [Kingdonia uniflora]|uniref:Protein kinase domain-containing protein n=1 Tax=Kingdonia uniflora TaxID=39325 RepID=A0A7J7PAW8_9MAGN|nr:hypothetical protein GIB67_034429 [Kingdonia uniflora]
MNDGSPVVVKRDRQTIHGEQEFQEEVSVIASIEHAHLVRLRGRRPFFILGIEYKVAETIAKTLEYLHGKGILHLRIKLENILFADDFQAVVSVRGQSMFVVQQSISSDFGLSNFMRKDESRGTAGYMAHEWFLDDFSEKCDVFSYGLLLLDMFLAREMFFLIAVVTAMTKGMVIRKMSS